MATSVTPEAGVQPSANTPAAAAGTDTTKTPEAPITPAAPNAGEAPKPPETPAAPAAAKGDSIVPEKYELKLPDDASIDATVLERTATVAKELGLSQDAAQRTLELLNAEVTTRVAAERDAVLKAHQPGGEEWGKMLDGWRAETLADTSLGKTEDERKATIQKGVAVVEKYSELNPTDAPAMKEFLNVSGLGEHPAAVRFFAWIGKQMGEGAMPLLGGKGGGERSAAEVLYGGTTNKTE